LYGKRSSQLFQSLPGTKNTFAVKPGTTTHPLISKAMADNPGARPDVRAAMIPAPAPATLLFAGLGLVGFIGRCRGA